MVFRRLRRKIRWIRRLTPKAKTELGWETEYLMERFEATSVGSVLKDKDTRARKKLEKLYENRAKDVPAAKLNGLQSRLVRTDRDFAKAFSDFGHARLKYFEELLGYARKQKASKLVVKIAKDLIEEQEKSLKRFNLL